MTHGTQRLTAIKNKIGFVGGIAVFLILLWAPLDVEPQIRRTLAVLALCAVWWGTEAISIYATSLVPAVLLPLLGILPLQEALSQYANRLIFLFLGGFLIASACNTTMFRQGSRSPSWGAPGRTRSSSCSTSWGSPRSSRPSSRTRPRRP